MSLRFTKMHGLGNDFVVVDGRGSNRVLDAARVRALANRHTGVGFDQLLTIEPARDPACIAAYSIHNADGSPAGQCGNGVRCIGAWLHRDGAIAIGDSARLESPAGVVSLRLVDAYTVAVDMGEPDFDPAHLPLVGVEPGDWQTLDVDGTSLRIAAVSMGNPHAVLVVGEVNAAEVDRLGPLITRHPRFPEGVNAGFVQVIDAANVRLRVHERGAGWTLACGSGACAAVAALRRVGSVSSNVCVELPGGSLRIAWEGPGHALWMTGPAAFVFEGEWLGG